MFHPCVRPVACARSEAIAMLKLKNEMVTRAISQLTLGRAIGVSAATINLISNYNRWPKRLGGEPALRPRIEAYLIAQGADPQMVSALFDEVPQKLRSNAASEAAANAADHGPQGNSDDIEDAFMLLRKHTLSRAARAHFKIVRDPFTDEMNDEADVFLSDDIRYVRASMRQTAKHGGMLAVIAESGGGKSTLRHDLAEWINTAGEPITVIEPYVIGMEDSSVKGKALKAGDITGAVIRAMSPGTTMRAGSQDRAAQMHSILKASAQIGRKHVLIIEEAHCLATPTLKHLKRFYELQDGFKKLLSIILIGQTELQWKLSEQNPDVREVVQRCELVTLPALDNQIEGYLRHKLKRAELDFDTLVSLDAIDEIRNQLRHSETQTQRGRRVVQSQSLCHPLAINNLVSAAMNEAVKIGAPKITGALIAAVARSA